MKQLESWVKGGKERNMDMHGQILLDIKHNLLSANYTEIPFFLDGTVLDMKEKIYTMTGSSCACMVLTLNNVRLADDRTLRSYNPKARALLYVQDTDPFSLARGGGLEDVSKVKKYVMSDEDYARRKNTVRAFIEQKKKEDPTWVPPRFQSNETPIPADGRTLEEVLAEIKVGDRCEVFPGARRGEVKFVGYVKEIPAAASVAVPAKAVTNQIEAKVEKETEAKETEATVTEAKETEKEMEKEVEAEKEEAEVKRTVPQVWIGVCFDDPVGKNDGSIKGKRYFQAQTGYGAFVKPAMVTVGEFPEEDPFATSDDEASDENLEL